MTRLDTNASWRPIETAPKDGSKFIATDGCDVYMCAWHAPSETMGHWHNPDDGSPLAQMFDEWKPTNWMPLPELPL